MDCRIFCSSLSRERGERIFGTAPLVERWVLLEDRGIWNEPAVPDRNLPQQALYWLKHAASPLRQARPLLIRQGHCATGALRCFFVEASETGPVIRRVLFESYNELKELDPDTAGETVDGPMFLVCTHGRHDKCCARYGLPVYRALRRLFPEHAWECSHVGGDRFAANLLCFPHGLYYGHLTPDDARAAARAYVSGGMALGNYRGRSCYPRPAQVAEFFVRSEHGLAGVEALGLRSVERLARHRWRVAFVSRDTGETFTVEFEENTEAQSGLLTCGAAGPKKIRQYHPAIPID